MMTATWNYQALVLVLLVMLTVKIKGQGQGQGDVVPTAPPWDVIQDLKCFQCSGGVSCEEPTADLLVKCEESIGCMATSAVGEVDSTLLVVRGCVGKDEGETLTEIPTPFGDCGFFPSDNNTITPFCFCNTSECNYQPFKLHPIPNLTCQSCGGGEDQPECTDTETEVRCDKKKGMNYGCLTVYTPTKKVKGCSGNPMGFMTAYGCKETGEIADFEFHSEDSSSGLFCLCDSNNCNADLSFEVKPKEVPNLECYVCKDCTFASQIFSQLKPCDPDSRFGCYTTYNEDDGTVERGCIKEGAFSNVGGVSCLEMNIPSAAEAGKTILAFVCICKSDGCNDNDFRYTSPLPDLSCYECSGEECKTGLTLTEKESKKCQPGENFGCMTMVNRIDNSVQRSCSVYADKSLPSRGCSSFHIPEQLVDGTVCVCRENNCNNANPFNVLQCYQCVECEAINEYLKPSSCPFDRSNACFKVSNEMDSNKVYRGCAGPGPTEGSAYTVNSDVHIRGDTYYCSENGCNNASTRSPSLLAFMSAAILLVGLMKSVL